MNSSCFFKLVEMCISEFFVNFNKSSIFGNPYKIFDFSQAFSKITKRIPLFISISSKNRFGFNFFENSYIFCRIDGRKMAIFENLYQIFDFFQARSRLPKGIPLLISISRCCFWLFFRKFVQFFHNRQKKYGNF